MATDTLLQQLQSVQNRSTGSTSGPSVGQNLLPTASKLGFKLAKPALLDALKTGVGALGEGATAAFKTAGAGISKVMPYLAAAKTAYDFSQNPSIGTAIKGLNTSAMGAIAGLSGAGIGTAGLAALPMIIQAINAPGKRTAARQKAERQKFSSIGNSIANFAGTGNFNTPEYDALLSAGGVNRESTGEVESLMQKIYGGTHGDEDVGWSQRDALYPLVGLGRVLPEFQEIIDAFTAGNITVSQFAGASKNAMKFWRNGPGAETIERATISHTLKGLNAEQAYTIDADPERGAGDYAFEQRAKQIAELTARQTVIGGDLPQLTNKGLLGSPEQDPLSQQNLLLAQQTNSLTADQQAFLREDEDFGD